MHFITILKKVFWVSIAPIMIGLIFQSGVMWNKVNSIETKIGNAVSKEIWKETDKKIDLLVENVGVIGKFIVKHSEETIREINAVEIKVVALDGRVRRLELDNVKMEEKLKEFIGK